MRQGQHSRRNRGRGGRRPQGGPQGGSQGSGSRRTYDSNGPNVKVRGTPSQIYEKYQVLAREAYVSGNRIAAENYLQHAEHYYRICTENGTAAGARTTPAPAKPEPHSRPTPQPPVLPRSGAADGAEGQVVTPVKANGTVAETAVVETDAVTGVADGIDGQKAAPASEPRAADDGVRKTVTRRRRKPAARTAATEKAADTASD